ncbi:hypothetical protein OsJ_30591 [Oryza sativa Japonica Group]|nr:hypothetical protein OsJ_30591 [Oryza sativa Japonica Group]
MAGTPGKRLRYTASRRVGSTLSDLPEGVLHHIMSFLDSRQAVQMCVLLQRWRNLWRSMPRINIDCKESSHQHRLQRVRALQAPPEVLHL